MTRLPVILLAILATFSPLRAQQSDDESKRVNEALTALDEIMAAADKSVPRSVMEKSVGIAVFPSLHRADVALQIGRDILPGVQSPRHPVVGIVSAGGRTSGGHLVSNLPS